MPRRGLLLAILPATGLGFSPPTPAGAFSNAGIYRSSRSTHHQHVLSGIGSLGGAEGPVVGRSRTSTLGRREVRMSLVEEEVTAAEATELITKAKTIVEADMGVKVPGMLSPEFRFLWQFNGELSRDEYLKEGKGPYASLRAALPDLFWNAYDFRVDKYESNRVWATTRLSGTHNGPLVLDGKEHLPSGNRVEAAPECVSLVFDKSSGLCTKMTGGFCMDRGAGNTGPAGGIWGVLQAIGEPVPSWKYFPPAKVIGDILGPTFRPKKSPGTTKPPFREAIAIALTKQVLTAGRDDPDALADLLADDVQIYAPILGPLKKKEFVQSATVDLKNFFSGLDVDDNFYDARVDPLEPSRVWITTRPSAKVVGPLSVFGAKFEPKRTSYQAGPESLSVTFDKDGYASKITLGCPMDTDLGQTGGLCNFLGIMEGLGIPLPGYFSRPVPVSFRRLISSVSPKPKPKPKPMPKAKPAATKEAAPAKSAAKKAAIPVKTPAFSLPSMPAPALPKPAPPAKRAPAPVAKPASATSNPKPTPKPKPVAAPKPVNKTAVAPKPVSVKKAAPAKPVVGTKKAPASSSPAKQTSPVPAKPAAGAPETAAPAAKQAASSPFGGLFSFGGGKDGAKKAEGEVAAGGEVAKKAPVKKQTAPAKKPPAAPASTPAMKAAPVKKPAPVPATTPAKKAKAAAPPALAASGGSKGVSFSPALAQKLEAAVGSAAALKQLSMRTDLYARGGISAMDYWGTLKKTLGPDGVQNLGPDIIGALPAGNQKSALFKIYSTG